MDPKLEHSISNFFDQLFQVLLAFVAAPLIVIFLLVGLFLYWAFKDSHKEKIKKWLSEKLSTTAVTKQSQRGAILSIRLIFDELVKHFNHSGRNDLNYGVIDASIDRVIMICEMHKLPREFVEHYIDACIALVNTRKYNSIYVKLTTKFQR